MDEQTILQLGAGAGVVAAVAFLFKVVVDSVEKLRNGKHSSKSGSGGSDSSEKLGTLIDQQGLRLEAALGIDQKVGTIMTDVGGLRQELKGLAKLLDEREHRTNKRLEALEQR